MEAAIYSRVSTADQQEGASLTTQRNDCARYADAKGMAVVGEYLDVQSGLKSDRKQYQAMLSDAKAGKFGLIIVWKLDRFGRDRIESGIQLRELAKVGVRVDSATEPNDSPLLRNILMDFAEEESRRISIRVSANRKTRSQAGLRSGKSCFGYVNTPVQGGGVTLEPHPVDGPIVTECFRRYATGRYSLAGLRDYIGTLSTSSEKLLTRGAIHYMLKNPVYLGKIHHGKWAKSEIQVASPEERQSAAFMIDGQHPALTDHETFDQVQEIMAGHLVAKAAPNTPFFFTGMVRCGECGARYTGHKNGRNSRSYYCTRHNDNGDCANKSVSETKLKAAVIEPLEQVVIEWLLPETRMALMQRDSELVQRQRKAESAGKEGVAEELARLETELEGYSRMRARDEFTAEEYQEYRNKILPQIASLKELVSAAPVKVQTLEPLVKALDLLAVQDGHLVKDGEPLDTADWRWLLSMTLEGITIVEGVPQVTWKEFISME